MEIDLLNKDKELSDMRMREQDVELKNQVLIRNSVIGGIGFTSAIVIVLIIGYRRSIKANKKIDQQNSSIRSSINYAKRIQQAMLHKADQYLEGIPDSFILFKPRDAVSGDFYWFSEIKYSPDIAFAAVDCTGHGVPGAFMSMIGINSLNGIIGHGVAESNEILDALDLDVRTALQQEKTGNTDGMDVALCIYRKEKNLVEYSGAKNPLIYIQDNTLNVIKGDTRSIGGNQNKKEYFFKKHLVSIDKPTMIYLFSDGYCDQFGGDDNSKFKSKRFHKLLLDIHNEPMDKQKEMLNKEILAWQGNRSQTDDILVMGLRIDSGTIN